MYLYPLRFRKYGHGSFLEVNVISLVVMYTNKVLRPRHMFMLEAMLFWWRRLKEKTVCGSVGWRRRQQMVSCPDFSLRVLKACYFGHRFFWVILGSPVFSVRDPRWRRSTPIRSNETQADGIECQSSRQFYKHFEFLWDYCEISDSGLCFGCPCPNCVIHRSEGNVLLLIKW